MEELRTLRSEFEAGGGKAIDAAAAAAAAAAAGGGDDAATVDDNAAVPDAATFRELLRALDAVQPRRGPPPAQTAAADGKGQQEQQQEQRAEEGAAANGDAMDVDEAPQPSGRGADDAKAGKQQQQQQRKYGDATCGYGSDDEPAAFSDAEGAVLGVGRAGRIAEAWAARSGGGGGSSGAAAAAGGAAPPDAARLEAWRERFRGNAAGVAALERVASASAALFMDAQGALACLCGRGGRYLVRRAAATIGRSTDSRGDVDVDLAREGGDAAGRVSRLQAQLLLRPDGAFWLTNVGRRAMAVDGAPLARGEAARVGHLSLLEVGGLRLLVLVNAPAVARALARVEQLVM